LAADEAALEVADLPASDPVRVAAVAGMLVEALFAPAASLDALEVIVDDAMGPLAAAAGHVLDFRRTTGGPVPLTDLLSAVEAATSAQGAEGLWFEVQAEVQHVQQLSSRWRFETGERLHTMLFEEGELLDLLLRAAAGEERSSLIGRLPKDVKRYIDDLIRSAALPPMEWGRQSSYLTRLRRIVRSARRAAIHTERGVVPTIPPHVVAATTELAEQLAELVEGLREEPGALPPPFDVPIGQLVDALGPVLAWRELGR
jgi:hypothetical protein